jgi:hypothetical protein
MTSRLAKSGGNSDLSSVRPQAGAGRFMVTLCALDAPVSIRQPQSPRLKPFTFFVTRAHQADGTERLYLNMGYFNTLADADRWAQTTRRQFPGAFATVASGAPSWPTRFEAPASSVLGSHSAATGGRDPEASKVESLTDTQVLKILEKRRDPAVCEEPNERSFGQIELLRPDDTITRQVLREAVVQDAPVWFAVQLHWSAQPIELSLVRSLPVFKAHTLYATGSRRNGRSRYFLRLGFFADPISAKQIAVQVRSTFDSAAVVPVVEPEITRAREAGAANAIPYLEESRLDPQSDSGADSASGTVVAPKEREMWSEPDLLSESGVRHLRVERQEYLSGRWKIIRLRDDSLNEAQFQA